MGALGLAFHVLIRSRLYFIMSVGYLVSTMNGFDSSLMGAINAMGPYQATFHLDGAGMSLSVIMVLTDGAWADHGHNRSHVHPAP